MSCVTVINAGSSSIKLAIFAKEANPALLARGHVDGLGAEPRLRLSDGAGNFILEQKCEPGLTHEQATQMLTKLATERLPDRVKIVAVGHRVVHGGPQYSAPMRVTAALLRELEAFVPLAPLHQPHNLAPIRAIESLWPDLPQVVCFDTAFHRAQPAVAQTYAIPRKYTQEGVRCYGFHGISYEFVAARLAEIAPDVARKRVIIAHLGSGASLCAICDGASVASSMGFTALDGLVMGTRCGALDPGVILHLMRHYELDVNEVEDLLYKKCGLIGVSEISSDMRALRVSDDARAREAIDLFVYRIRRQIGSLVAALGGLDALVFTAGIGENDAATRREVAAGCAWLGIEIDEARNNASDMGAGLEISAQGASARTFVIPTNEELRIALATGALISNP
ncbi:MAG: acetate/propionate family kinase [Rhodoblastus sp.]